MKIKIKSRTEIGEELYDLVNYRFREFGLSFDEILDKEFDIEEDIDKEQLFTVRIIHKKLSVVYDIKLSRIFISDTEEKFEKLLGH